MNTTFNFQNCKHIKFDQFMHSLFQKRFRICRLMCHQRRNMSTAAKSLVFRRNISFQIYVFGRFCQIGKKLASYPSLRKRQRFCAIQFDAYTYANKISRGRFVDFDAVARNQRTCRRYFSSLLVERRDTLDKSYTLLAEDKTVYSINMLLESIDYVRIFSKSIPR